jgi:hypothetical protein
VSPSVFPCYAPQDRPIAARIAEFLEAGAGVRVFVEDGEIRPGEDLVSKARDARTADIVLVLFSRHSLPPRWTRAQWEPALVTEPAEDEVRIAFIRCDDCAPPPVLKPRFEASLTGQRALKRWLRTGHALPAVASFPPDLESLAAALADRPGTATAADAAQAARFAHEFRDDFGAVFSLECAGRTLTGITGELAAALGLRLEGYLMQNLARLREFCAARRFLVVLANAAPGQTKALAFGGRCSTLIARGEGLPCSEDPLVPIQRALAETDPAADWNELCALARQGRRRTRDQGRVAECYELMQQWQAEAELRGDRSVQEESAREMVWILESWGRVEEAQALEYRRRTQFADQLMLPFSGTV